MYRAFPLFTFQPFWVLCFFFLACFLVILLLKLFCLVSSASSFYSGLVRISLFCLLIWFLIVCHVTSMFSVPTIVFSFYIVPSAGRIFMYCSLCFFCSLYSLFFIYFLISDFSLFFLFLPFLLLLLLLLFLFLFCFIYWISFLVVSVSYFFCFFNFLRVVDFTSSNSFFSSLTITGSQGNEEKILF